jgi:hypothetical protein
MDDANDNSQEIADLPLENAAIFRKRSGTELEGQVDAQNKNKAAKLSDNEYVKEPEPKIQELLGFIIRKDLTAGVFLAVTSSVFC